MKNRILALVIAVIPTLLLACVMVLTGCSSTPHRPPTEQMCNMRSETVATRDMQGNILSQKTKEVMVCSDDQLDRITIKKAGLASNCGEYVYYINLNGKAVAQRGIACQKFDGRWEVVNN
jgi:hypothetical protein